MSMPELYTDIVSSSYVVSDTKAVIATSNAISGTSSLTAAHDAATAGVARGARTGGASAAGASSVGGARAGVSDMSPAVGHWEVY